MTALHPRFKAWLLQTYSSLPLSMFNRLDPQTQYVLVSDLLRPIRRLPPVPLFDGVLGATK